MAQRQGSLDRPFFPRRSTGSLLPDKAVGNFALCAAGLPGHRKTCTPCQHMHQCCPCLWQGASLQTGRKSPSFSPWEVVQAEAADGLDPISALREQRRAAVRAQAVVYCGSGWNGQSSCFIRSSLTDVTTVAAFVASQRRTCCGGFRAEYFHCNKPARCLSRR